MAGTPENIAERFALSRIVEEFQRSQQPESQDVTERRLKADNDREAEIRETWETGEKLLEAHRSRLDFTATDEISKDVALGGRKETWGFRVKGTPFSKPPLAWEHISVQGRLSNQEAWHDLVLVYGPRRIVNPFSQDAGYSYVKTAVDTVRMIARELPIQHPQKRRRIRK